MPNPNLDAVNQASDDSFPASDPPSYGGATAAPSSSTVLPPDVAARKARLRRMWIGGGALALGIAAGLSVLLVLRARAR